MLSAVTGTILFIFSDPGGAKPCLALIEEERLPAVVAASDRTYPFYKIFKTPVTIIGREFEEFVDTVKPSLIFTGTSYTSDIERRFIKIAAKKNIPCYSFVDHWTAILKRFEDVDGTTVLPDKIWVIDERAKELAIEQGIDKKKLVVSGNPYHSWLKSWKPSIDKDSYLKQIGINGKAKKVLAYAPDPLSNINGKATYGFDEVSATSILIDVFNNNKESLKNWTCLIKAHPNQAKEKLTKIVSGHSSFLIVTDDVDANTIIYYSDVVMGFFSSFLIEASVLKKPVLRFLINEVENDPLHQLNIGSVVNANSIMPYLLKL